MMRVGSSLRSTGGYWMMSSVPPSFASFLLHRLQHSATGHYHVTE
jgi:hypothetical protein